MLCSRYRSSGSVIENGKRVLPISFQAITRIVNESCSVGLSAPRAAGVRADHRSRTGRNAFRRGCWRHGEILVAVHILRGEAGVVDGLPVTQHRGVHLG